MADDSIREKATAEPDANLLQHVEALGLKTVDEYVEWCGRHGFSQRTKKNWKERLKERSFVTRAAADLRIARNKNEVRKPEKVIERIFQGGIGEGDVSQPYLKVVCRAFEISKSFPQTQRTFHHLLLHVRKHANVTDVRSVIPDYGREDGNTFIGGLLALAGHAAHWLKPVEDWRPESHSTRRQFASLARHLFARWPIPVFMDAAWFKGGAEEAIRQQGWFLHVGRGENVRTANLPLTFTKRMAHHFMQAPPDFTVEAALRWGQVLGMGGEPRLARAIMGTRLGMHFAHEDFWVEVLRFFIANPMLDLAHAGPIIDFIHHQKFVPQAIAVAPGVVEQRPPAQPNFSLKGRTAAALLKLVGSWHQLLGRARQPHAEWCGSGIEGLQLIEESGGNVRIWTISELLDSKALVAEGREMQHCVASYVSSCLHGASSIWTLESETNGERRKVLTVEVDPVTRVICQVRGKRNVLPGDKHREILHRWAAQASLQLAGHV